MNEKYIQLAREYIEGWEWQLFSILTEKGTFHNVGRYNFRKIRGYKGGYKGKTFYYKVKLPKGANRHHVVYRDSDPNYGIIFCTPEYHACIHNFGGNTRWQKL